MKTPVPWRTGVAAAAWIACGIAANSQLGGDGNIVLRAVVFFVLPIISMIALEADTSRIADKLEANGKDRSLGVLLPSRIGAEEPNPEIHWHLAFLVAASGVAAAPAFWGTLDSTVLRFAAVAMASTCVSLIRVRGASVPRAWRIIFRWVPAGMLAFICVVAVAAFSYGPPGPGTGLVAAGASPNTRCDPETDPDPEDRPGNEADPTITEESVLPPQTIVIDHGVCRYENVVQVALSVLVDVPVRTNVEAIDVGLDGDQNPTLVFVADPDLIEGWDTKFTSPHPTDSSLAPGGAFTLAPNPSGVAGRINDDLMISTQWPSRAEIEPGGIYYDGRVGHGRLVFEIPAVVYDDPSFLLSTVALIEPDGSWASQSSVDDWRARTADPTKF